MGCEARKPDFVACEEQWCRPACALRSLISAFVIHILESIIQYNLS